MRKRTCGVRVWEKCQCVRLGSPVRNFPECKRAAWKPACTAWEAGSAVMRRRRSVRLWTISCIASVLVLSSTLLMLAMEMSIALTSPRPADPWWYARSIAVHRLLIHLRTASAMFAFEILWDMSLTNEQSSCSCPNFNQLFLNRQLLCTSPYLPPN